MEFAAPAWDPYRVKEPSIILYVGSYQFDSVQLLAEEE